VFTQLEALLPFRFGDWQSSASPEQRNQRHGLHFVESRPLFVYNGNYLLVEWNATSGAQQGYSVTAAHHMAGHRVAPVDYWTFASAPAFFQPQEKSVIVRRWLQSGH
jgi:hypothetical protein